MWSIIFVILMLVVFGKILKFAVKATWSGYYCLCGTA